MVYYKRRGRSAAATSHVRVRRDNDDLYRHKDDQSHVLGWRNRMELSKSCDDLNAWDGPVPAEQDPTTFTNSNLCLDVPAKAQRGPKPLKSAKEGVCGYLKKLRTHNNGKALFDVNENVPQGEVQNNKKSSLLKLKNLSKSLQSLFDKPSFDVAGAQDTNARRNEKIPNAEMIEEIEAQNEAVSVWVETGYPPGVDPRNFSSDSNVSNEGFEELISSAITEEYNDEESNSIIQTEAPFQHEHGSSPCSTDLDFDEITDITYLTYSENAQLTSNGLPESQPRLLHDSVENGVGYNSPTERSTSAQIVQSRSNQPAAAAELLHDAHNGASGGKDHSNRHAASGIGKCIQKIKIHLPGRTACGNTKNSDSSKMPPATTPVDHRSRDVSTPLEAPLTTPNTHVPVHRTEKIFNHKKLCRAAAHVTAHDKIIYNRRLVSAMIDMGY